MANGGEKNDDFYAVLGLNKQCTATELRNAYKKLALKWHPDRCSASGNSNFVEEAKKKFQKIQQAYSVLSDESKRFLYDVGAYDSEDDGDENGMGDFLSEMATMMSQTKPRENGEESFEELQELFQEMFEEQIEELGQSNAHQVTTDAFSNSSLFTSYSNNNDENSNNNKRNSSAMNSGKVKLEDSSGFNGHFQRFCFGAEHHQDVRGKGARGVPLRVGGGSSSSRRRNGRKQTLSSSYDVSSNDYSPLTISTHQMFIDPSIVD